MLPSHIPGSSNGKTTVSDTVNAGSNPAPGATHAVTSSDEAALVARLARIDTEWRLSCAVRRTGDGNGPLTRPSRVRFPDCAQWSRGQEVRHSAATRAI